MRGKRFQDMSPSGKRLTSIVIAVSLVLVAAAERDIQNRPPTEVNGSKLVWRVVCTNAIGALSYFRWGRRTTPA